MVNGVTRQFSGVRYHPRLKLQRADTYFHLPPLIGIEEYREVVRTFRVTAKHQRLQQAPHLKKTLRACACHHVHKTKMCVQCTRREWFLSPFQGKNCEIMLHLAGISTLTSFYSRKSVTQIIQSFVLNCSRLRLSEVCKWTEDNILKVQRN